jgi:hypothetical protein
MKIGLKGIVLTVVGILELSFILFSIIAVPFPQLLDVNLVKSLNEELQREFDEMMSDKSFSDQIIEQLTQSMQEQMQAQMSPMVSPNQNQNEREAQNNENLLFEFQIADESVEPINPQSEVQGAMQVPDSRTDTIVPISEWHVGTVDTKPGCIYFEGYIDHELDLCWNEETTADWWLRAYVCGGYTPLLGPSVMLLSQWDKEAQEYRRFMVDIIWEYEYKGECCSGDVYIAKFVPRLPICFDSNQYPRVGGHPGFNLCPPEEKIPGKEVCVMILMDWAGCEDDNQHFKILSVRDKYQFSCL